jgi:hypothetical protein
MFQKDVIGSLTQPSNSRRKTFLAGRLHELVRDSAAEQAVPQLSGRLLAPVGHNGLMVGRGKIEPKISGLKLADYTKAN